uniref:Protein amnionless n=1 Tax=Syphacia muris TaxID=451379 RepID=A0A158R4C0_9BILA
MYEIDQDTLNRILNSVEGHYQWNFGKANGDDDEDDQWNDEYPILIRSRKSDDYKFGVYNRNLDEKLMNIICRSVKCPNINNLCSHPFMPVGHCCKVCGASIIVTGLIEGFSAFLEKLEQYNDDTLAQHGLQLSMIRIDDNKVPQYQIIDNFAEKLALVLLLTVIALVSLVLSLCFISTSESIKRWRALFVVPSATLSNLSVRWFRQNDDKDQVQLSGADILDQNYQQNLSSLNEPELKSKILPSKPTPISSTNPSTSATNEEVPWNDVELDEIYV